MANKKQTYIVLILSFTFSLYSCKKEKHFNDINDSLEYIYSHKEIFNKQNISNGISYNLRLITPELKVAGDKNNLNREKDKLKLIYDSVASTLGFVFIIKDTGSNSVLKEKIKNKLSYSQLLSISNNELHESFKLIINQKEIPCSIVHMEASSNVNPELRIALSFNYNYCDLFKNEDEFSIKYDDYLLENGTLYFNFSNIKSTLPQLLLL